MSNALLQAAVDVAQPQPEAGPAPLSSLRPVEKAAVVVMALGEDVAAQVLGSLTPKELKRLSASIAAMPDLEQEEIDAVVGEFHQALNEGRWALPGATSFLQGAMTKALGGDRAAKLLGEVADEATSLQALDDVDPRMLAQVLQKEHPQTVSLVVAHMDPEKASAVIASLPEDQQLEVCYRVARLDAVSGDILSEVEQALLGEVRGMAAHGAHAAGGVKLVADILNQMDKASEVRIIETIDDMNPELAEELRQLMFTFEDLAKLDDRGMQALLKDVDNTVLVLALKTASEPIRDKILRNLSKRAADMVLDDLENLGPVRLSEVERAQNDVVRAAVRLEEEGRIHINGTVGDDEFV